MGKGRILGGGTGGLYTIEILEDRTRAESNRATAVARVASIDTRISELTTELADAQSDVDAAAAAQDQAIADYQAALDDPQIDTKAARKAMTDASEALVQVAAKRDAIARNIGALKSERLSVQKRIDLIDALPPLRQISAWCADFIEDLSGDVATAEVPGEIGQVIIQPGYTDGAAWSPTDDGAIQPALSGTAASVFYNLAMMPGWQKWRPTFRIATISNISNDLCDITLDAATSSQQGLGVNAQGSYTGVPIMYMDCNGDAFENGDKVLVAFSGNTDSPMVVGFESNPKECFNYASSVTIYPGQNAGPFTRYAVGCGSSGTNIFENYDDTIVGIHATTGRLTAALITSYMPDSLNETVTHARVGHNVGAVSAVNHTGGAGTFSSQASIDFSLTDDGGGIADTLVELRHSLSAAAACIDEQNGEIASLSQSSTISVGGISIDLFVDFGWDIMQFAFFSGTFVNGEIIRQNVSALINDPFVMHYDRAADGSLYIAVEFNVNGGEPTLRYLAFYRERGGAWSRVQARGVPADQQAPDYESLPVV